ncbi:MAG: queuosine precursor transporter [Planctomycetes bacterium]|nr:queuosine precursor transporter [Planctomycetota bacterium]
MKRKDIVFAVLGAFFLTNAVLAEIIGGKLIYVAPPDFRIGPLPWIGLELGPFIMSVGVIPWPVVFVTTDLVNEYFGRRGVRRLTFLAVAMIAYAFVVIYLTMLVPAVPPQEPGKGVDDASYRTVLGPSMMIIVGSITAFLIAQLIDVTIFHLVRRRTGKSMIWLRATGSTVISQLVDSIVVLYIGLALPWGWSLQQFVSVAATNYSVKLLIAVAMTPVIYLGHSVVEWYIGRPEAEALAEEAARDRAP